MENIIQTDIQFDPTTHTYLRKGIPYTSCTTVIDKFKKPFDRRYWAMYSTLKETFYLRVRAEEDYGIIYVNNTPHSIDSLYGIEVYREACKMMKNGWDDITKVACDRGNVIHDFLETSVNTSKDDEEGATNLIIKPLTGGNMMLFSSQHDLDKTNLLEVYPEIYHTLLFYINRGCTIYAEKKVYIDEYKISGMIDCLIVKGHKFAILDWKTNKDIIHFNSGYYRKEKVDGKYIKTNEWIHKSKPMLAPLQYLEECKGTIYTLQVSLYAYMLESWGYELIQDGLMIYHIRPNERPKLLKVPYMKEDIKLMLDYYKQNLAA